MNRSPKDIKMMAVIGVLMLFAVYNFVIKPQGTSLSDTQADRVVMEQSVSDAQLQLQAPTTTLGVTAGADAAELAEAVPADPALPTLIRQLNAISVETSMKQSSISPSPLAINPNGPGGSMQITIAASGTHDASEAYVLRLRDLERLFVIEQIGTTLDAEGTEQLQITGRVFTQSPPVDAAATAAVVAAATLTTESP